MKPLDDVASSVTMSLSATNPTATNEGADTNHLPLSTDSESLPLDTSAGW